MCLAGLVLLGGTGLAAEAGGERGGYRLDRPDRTWKLPGALQEISGIALVDGQTVACVQDEKGIIYMYDLDQGRMVSTHGFGPDGDYEDLVVHGADAWVLRSDGVILEVRDYRGARPEVRLHVTGIPAADNEGLGLAADGRRLLLACKSNPATGTAGSRKLTAGQRLVYAYDPASRQLSAGPVLVLDLEEVSRAGRAEEPPPEDSRKGKKGKQSGKKNQAAREGQPPAKVRLSAVACHPLTGEVWLLSALDQRLYVLGPAGEFRRVLELDGRLLPQPEGLAFRPNGDLLLSSEGRSGPGVILEFRYGAGLDGTGGKTGMGSVR